MKRLKILIFVSLCIALSAAFKCGVRKIPQRIRRVVNGEQSYRGQWPWFVSLYEKRYRRPDELIGGATLINERTLITSKF